MAAVPRGRGFAVALPKTQELRRPGEPGVKSRMGNNSITSVSQQNSVARDKFETLCEKIVKMNLSSSPKEALLPCADNVKSSCTTTEDLEKFVENLFQYALKSKWNAHAVALFAQHHGDISVNQVKFRTIMLRKLQGLYMERNKSYLELNQFLLDATFACEIFHHIRIEGSCLKVLAHPVIDYLCMLVDGASLKEIEVFVEQFPKCFQNVKENDSSGLDTLLSKIRKQIVAETTVTTVKAMLLEMFELILTDFNPLTQNAKILYDSLSKPVVRICD